MKKGFKINGLGCVMAARPPFLLFFSASSLSVVGGGPFGDRFCLLKKNFSYKTPIMEKALAYE